MAVDEMLAGDAIDTDDACVTITSTCASPPWMVAFICDDRAPMTESTVRLPAVLTSMETVEVVE